jgi:hypothetical protein
MLVHNSLSGAHSCRDEKVAARERTSLPPGKWILSELNANELNVFFLRNHPNHLHSQKKENHILHKQDIIL